MSLAVGRELSQELGVSSEALVIRGPRAPGVPKPQMVNPQPLLVGGAPLQENVWRSNIHIEVLPAGLHEARGFDSVRFDGGGICSLHFG